MERACDYCGTMYTPRRSTSRYHSPSCRAQAAKARAAGRVVSLPPAGDVPEGALVVATRRELVEAGMVETTLGQQALELARRISVGHDSGSSIAALSKELRVVMSAALASVEDAGDPIDELKAWRDRKRSAAG